MSKQEQKKKDAPAKQRRALNPQTSDAAQQQHSAATLPKAIRQLKVNVSQAEIDMAVPSNSKHCMISDALKRHYGRRISNVVTDKEATAFTERKTGRRYKFALPPLARAALLQFDNGERVTPFTFCARNPIVRERKAHVLASSAKRGAKTPLLKGRHRFGASGQMSGANNKQRRLTRGMDRFFGKRIFKPELDAMRRQLGIEPPTVSQPSAETADPASLYAQPSA